MARGYPNNYPVADIFRNCLLLMIAVPFLFYGLKMQVEECTLMEAIQKGNIFRGFLTNFLIEGVRNISNAILRFFFRWKIGYSFDDWWIIIIQYPLFVLTDCTQIQTNCKFDLLFSKIQGFRLAFPLPKKLLTLGTIPYGFSGQPRANLSIFGWFSHQHVRPLLPIYSAWERPKQALVSAFCSAHTMIRLDRYPLCSKKHQPKRIVFWN